MMKDNVFFPMKDRSLGGFKVRDIIALLYKSIKSNTVSNINFWCCETACKRITSTWATDDNDRKISINYTLNDYHESLANIGSKHWMDVSTIEFITAGIINTAFKEKSFYFPNFSIEGLNGVGYITEGMDDILTFDQSQQHATIIEILELERTQKHLANASKSLSDNQERKLDRLQNTFQGHMNDRGCHRILFDVDFLALKEEIRIQKKLRSAEKKYQKQLHATAMQEILSLGITQ